MSIVPLISFIVPIFNAEAFLAENANSIIRQQISCEIILINDGSTDNSLDIANDFVQQYPFVYLISSQNNGVSEARNAGLRLVRGKYVMFADGDDFLPDSCRLKDAVALADSHHADIIKGICLTDRKSPPGSQPASQPMYYPPVFSEISTISNKMETGHIFLKKMHGANVCFIQIGSFLFRKNFLDKNHLQFDAALSVDEDHLFILDAPLTDATLIEIFNFFIFYRNNNGGLSLIPPTAKRLADAYVLVSKIKERISDITENDHELHSALDIIRDNWYRDFQRLSLCAGHDDTENMMVFKKTEKN